MKRKPLLVFLTVVSCTAFALGSAACGGHAHTYSEDWTCGDTHHWHEATCEHTDEVSGYAEHTWDGGAETTPATCKDDGVMTYTCTVCGYVKTEPIAVDPDAHAYSADWSSDETCHWHACTADGCDAKTDYAEHTFADNVCIVCGAAYVSGGLMFSLNGDAYTVRIGTCTDADIVIPSVYNGKPVTSIADSAFSGYSSFTSIEIPDSITSIGDYAFA